MALEYNLDVETELTPVEVQAVILSGTDLKLNGDCLEGNGVVASISETGYRSESVMKYFGFTPTVSIAMRLDKFEQRDEGRNSVIRIVSLLAKSIPGDMVLLFNHEYVYLLRKDGKVILNSYDKKLWNTEMLSLLDLPTESRDMGQAY